MSGIDPQKGEGAQRQMRHKTADVSGRPCPAATGGKKDGKLFYSLQVTFAVFLALAGLVYFPSFSSCLFLLAALLGLPFTRCALLGWAHNQTWARNFLYALLIAATVGGFGLLSPSEESTGFAASAPTPSPSATIQPVSSPTPHATASPAPAATPSSAAMPKETPPSGSSSSTQKSGSAEANVAASSTAPSEEPVSSSAVASLSPSSASSETPQQEVQQTMVWLSRTGTKYHNNPNCSNMTSPWQVTLEEAIAQGRTACKKCYG